MLMNVPYMFVSVPANKQPHFGHPSPGSVYVRVRRASLAKYKGHKGDGGDEGNRRVRWRMEGMG